MWVAGSAGQEKIEKVSLPILGGCLQHAPMVKCQVGRRSQKFNESQVAMLGGDHPRLGMLGGVALGGKEGGAFKLA